MFQQDFKVHDNYRLNTPVVLIIFNRPDATNRVFTEISRVKPPKLFVIADGPRLDKPGEAEACTSARSIIDRVDWDCEVLTNYSDVNLGGPRRIPSGLDWVFENVDQAIILEDDCLPNPSFFRFCEELLERYRNNTRIAMVSGNNFLFGQLPLSHSYYFSRYAQTWGWATWRRAWKTFDPDMKPWPQLRDEGWLMHLLQDKDAADYWSKLFDAVHDKTKFHWDYVWIFSCFVEDALTVVPNVNLVSNIGYGSLGTHTKDSDSILGSMKIEAMTFPLSHPHSISRYMEADKITFKYRFLTKIDWYNKMKGIVYNRIKDKKLYSLYKRIRASS